MDAVYIGLTGTPLLSRKERSNLKFGDYIHKYFYDKSIADGYTLRIKKENIDTIVIMRLEKAAIAVFPDPCVCHIIPPLPPVSNLSIIFLVAKN